MAFSTTIKGYYWNLKQQDEQEKGHFFEYKEDKDHWQKRIYPLIADQRQAPLDVKAIFLVGRVVHVRRIVAAGISRKQFIQEKYREAISTERCFWLRCEPVEEGG